MTTCAEGAGTRVPVINRNRCEGKADCVAVCPYGGFEVRVLGEDERRQLGLLGRLKAAAHGNRQASAVHAELCHACGLCVSACPERAIRLLPAGR